MVAVAGERDELVVELTSGRVAGRRSQGVSAFLGIPYAAPTGGAGRFRPPRPPAPWQGTRLATEYGPACPQPPIRENLVISPEVERAMFGLADEPQSEDCLSLNVWTPSLGDGSARPVLVSFHGGGFKSGSGSARSAPWFDGSRLALLGDVVVVTVNHRIGVLGHLDLEGLEGSGNAGLLDLVAALQWIKDNVERLGGDPGRVTIFGESGGGGKVMALIAMPRAAGLFHRAICQSATFQWLTREEAAEVAEAVRRELGVDSVQDLEGVDVQRLIASALNVTRAGMRFGPVVDGVSLAHDAIEALTVGAAVSLPLIVGVTRDEATAFLGAPQRIGWDALEARVGARAAHYRSRYPAEDPWRILVEITTDDLFRTHAVQAATAAAGRRSPVFMFEFAWPTPVLGGSLGAAHGVDVAFPFDNTELHPATAGSASARRLAPLVREAWVAFARDGDPNHAALPQWPRYDTADGATMIFDDECRVQRRPPRERSPLNRAG
jgi:para-nitrobenzyl esterase